MAFVQTTQFYIELEKNKTENKKKTEQTATRFQTHSKCIKYKQTPYKFGWYLF